MTDVLIIEDRKSEECGCPERELHINGIETIIHFEMDGTCDVFFDAGDWQHEMNVTADDIEHLQKIAVEWVENLPVEI